MPHFRKITGSRVYLSPLGVEDAEKLTIWSNDLMPSIYLGGSSSVTSLSGMLENLKDPSKNRDRFGILTCDGDRLIGSCALWGIDTKNRTSDLLIFIGEKDCWSKGYGTEALTLLLKYGFYNLNLNNIGLGVYGFNPRAIRCYEKCGFKEYGRRRKAILVGRKYYDFIWMDILAEEFFKLASESSKYQGGAAL